MGSDDVGPSERAELLGDGYHRERGRRRPGLPRRGRRPRALDNRDDRWTHGVGRLQPEPAARSRLRIARIPRAEYAARVLAEHPNPLVGPKLPRSGEQPTE